MCVPKIWLNRRQVWTLVLIQNISCLWIPVLPGTPPCKFNSCMWGRLSLHFISVGCLITKSKSQLCQDNHSKLFESLPWQSFSSLANFQFQFQLQLKWMMMMVRAFLIKALIIEPNLQKGNERIFERKSWINFFKTLTRKRRKSLWRKWLSGTN